MSKPDDPIGSPWDPPSSGPPNAPTLEHPAPFDTDPAAVFGPPPAPPSLGFGNPAMPDGPPAPGFGPPVQPKRTNPLAVASLVLGLVGCLVVTPLLAIVFGVVGRNQIKRSGGAEQGEGLAIGGIVLGVLWIPLLALFGAVAVLGTTVDPDDIPTRDEFVIVVAAPGLTDSMFGIDTMDPATADQARSLVREGMGCMYDALEREPRYLVAVYEDPMPDAGWHRLPGVSQQRVNEIDQQVEDCWLQLEDDFAALHGG